MSFLVEKIYLFTRWCHRPLWKATEFLLASDPSYKGTACKIGGLVGTVLFAPLFILAELLCAVCKIHTPFSFLTYTSPAPIKKEEPSSFLSFNACMFPGGLPVVLSGVSFARCRIEKLALLIKEQEADIVCLQEMAFDSTLQLMEKIQDRYAFFYYGIGPSPFRMESCLFVASKQRPTQEPCFIAFNIPGSQAGIRRGFFVIEFSSCSVITTHLDPYTGQGEIRAAQIKAILNHMKGAKPEPKPTYLIGDLNLEANDHAALQLLEKNFPNFEREAVSSPCATSGTCCDNLAAVARKQGAEPRWSTPDHILVQPAKGLKVAAKVPTFDLQDPSSALSDHYAVTLIMQ